MFYDCCNLNVQFKIVHALFQVQDNRKFEKPNISTNFDGQNGSNNVKTKLQGKNSDGETSLLGIAKNIALLYKNPIYILISICVATYFWVFICILTVVVDYGKDKGIEEKDTIYLIHSLNIGDLLGKYFVKIFFVITSFFSFNDIYKHFFIYYNLKTIFVCEL